MFKFLNQWAPLAGLSTGSLESGIAAIRDKVCSFIAMNIKRFETERLQVLAFAISHGFLYYDRDFGYYNTVLPSSGLVSAGVMRSTLYHSWVLRQSL